MFQEIILHVRDFVWGLPLLAFIISTGIITTITLNFLQFRTFFSSWKLIFAKQDTSGELSPFQAFLNALSTSLGNGSIAGMATAIHAGGPGAGFWIFIIGLFGMVLRFAEVYLATSFSTVSLTGRILGGPFLYLTKIPGGRYLPTFYAGSCLLYALTSGNAMQCNSISMALTHMVPSLSLWTVGIVLTIFVLYVLLGGAQRIVAVSDYIVPVKVGLFFVTCIGVLVYHWANIIPAILLMIKGAFAPQAVMGGAVGLTVQHIFRLSLTRTINASESGLGTAAIMYGATGSKTPLNDGLSAMLGTFISTNLVCTMVALSLIASGVWDSGANGSALTVAAFQTVFGSFGGWIITLLSIVFGVGVFVAYGFVGRQCWLFLTNDRFEHVFTVLFTLCALWGSVANITSVWAAIDIANAACLIINLFAILWLLPFIRSHALPSLNNQE